eukprot:9615711-Ditylum_brightwellii.AAC.1
MSIQHSHEQRTKARVNAITQLLSYCVLNPLAHSQAGGYFYMRQLNTTTKNGPLFDISMILHNIM